MVKKKILWVVYDFVQAGGQRYVYEICKALDKEKYEIDILKVSPMGYDKAWDKEFYYQPMLDAGYKVFFLADLLKKQQTIPRSFTKRLMGFIIRKSGLKINLPGTKSRIEISAFDILKVFFSDYNHVNFSGVGVYKTICISNKIDLKNAVIHILTSKFQNEKLYDGYDRNVVYNFVTGMTKDSLQIELADFKKYHYTQFPLCFHTLPFEIPIKVKNSIYHIAIFTRLSGMKPLDPYFYALKLLHEEGLQVKLIIYGAGDPEELGIIRQLNYLYIRHLVSFKGHTESIPNTLKEDNIDLVWFQSANAHPAGYAAFEISMSALPQVFWDFMYLGQTHPIGNIFPGFTELTSFVHYSKKLLLSEKLRKEIGIQQRNYVLENHSIQNHIHILEEIFDK